MAFLVEDGTGLSAANSYLSVADLQTHHTDRGIDLTGEASADLQAALVNATDYIDKRFGRRFRGDRRTTSQALEWPRSDAYSDEDYLFSGLPAALTKAVAEYAYLALRLARNLTPVPTPDFGWIDPETGEVTNDSAGKIIEKSEEVGPIKESTKYAPESQSGRVPVGTGNLTQRIPEYPQADLWLEELLRPYMSRRLSRG